MQVEIFGSDQKRHYTRPHDHDDVQEALRTTGYTVKTEAGEPIAQCDVCKGTGAMVLESWPDGEQELTPAACIQCNGARVMIGKASAPVRISFRLLRN